MADYFSERDRINIGKLRNLIDQLPEFCGQFFVGISNVTSPLTRLNYARDYLVFFKYLTTNVRLFKNTTVYDFSIDDLNKVKQEHIEIFLDHITLYTNEDNETRTNSEDGKTRKLASLRHLFSYLYNKNLLSENVSAKVSMPKKHNKEIIRLEKDEMQNFLETVEDGVGLSPREKKYHEITKLRDIAIITLLLGTGIRVSECVGLDINHLDLDNRSFVVTRKGGNRTILYMPDEVYDAIIDYLPSRLATDAPTNALFLSLQNNRIGVRSVQLLVKKFASASTPLKKITPHKLRSTFGTNLYRETKDIYVVAAVLGHSDVNTTKKHYAAIDDDIKRSAASVVKLHKKDEENE